MKKKKTYKKNTSKSKKNVAEQVTIENIDKKTPIIVDKKTSNSGIPKYVADRMARRIFFTTGIPTILGMSVFVVSYIIVTKNLSLIHI